MKGLRTSSSLTEIEAVELTDARRYVNMCQLVCIYIRLSCRIVHRNSMGRCGLQEVSYKDTSLFVCLWCEYTCTRTKRYSSNIRSGLRVPNKPGVSYRRHAYDTRPPDTVGFNKGYLSVTCEQRLKKDPVGKKSQSLFAWRERAVVLL